MYVLVVKIIILKAHTTMSFSAMMWGDSYCFQEYIYTFNTKKEYRRCIAFSIESSIYFLNTHVFSRRSHKNKYGFHIERYIKYNRCKSRDSEKKLRHSVIYWKEWLKRTIEEESVKNFQLENNIGSEMKNCIKLYL